MSKKGISITVILICLGLSAVILSLTSGSDNVNKGEILLQCRNCGKSFRMSAREYAEQTQSAFEDGGTARGGMAGIECIFCNGRAFLAYEDTQTGEIKFRDQFIR